MSYTALYREWRPQKFEDLVGQGHVTVTLKNQIKNDRIAHAYLLSGTRGTGKTSTAKILSKALNCLDLTDGEPCNECEMCKMINSGTAIDVVEMDAASHRGIDKMRDIISDAQYPPREAKYKVYIIDEVHMLTIEAVNAFLKTLEEPPSNVVFILATTDPQKLPITILSRCQRYDFRRISSGDIYQRLRAIVSDQGVLADDDSLNLIARMCDGAMRDALSVLDQCISMSDGKVDYDQVISMLGLVTNDGLIKLTDAIIEAKIDKAIKIVDDIVFSGKDIYTFIRDLITHMRNLMMAKVSNNPEEVLDMSKENIELVKEQAQKLLLEEIMRNIRILQEAEEQSKWSRQGRIYLEMSIVKMCKKEYDTSADVLISRINRLEAAIREGHLVVREDIAVTKTQMHQQGTVSNVKTSRPTVAKKDSDKKQEDIKSFNEDTKLSFDIVRKNWKDALELIKARKMMTLYASLTTGNIVGFSKGVIHINFSKEYYFNKKRLETDENSRLVEGVFSEVLKEKVKIRYSVDADEKNISQDDKKTEAMLLEKVGEGLVEFIDE